MGSRTVIPFGPQHPVLPEPVHLDLVLEDETVVEAIPSIGFVHRGLEMLVSKHEFSQMPYVAERICGICSFMHGMGCCQAIEEIMNIEPPPRAMRLRVFWAELSRVHSHLLWLGLAADAAGFESLFMHCWRVREKVLSVFEETTGGRVIFNVCKIGGQRRDVGDETLKRILGAVADVERECRDLSEIAAGDYSMRHRFEDIGILSREDAVRYGAVGPTLRASGVAQDMRKLGYAAYGGLRFEPVTESSCDCMGRLKVRAREMLQSFDLIRQSLDNMPGGPVDTKVPGSPDGEFYARLEQPRGEVIYYVKADGSKFLSRFRVRTPTFANIPALVKMLEGCELADVPIIVLSIDPCISCTER